VNKPDFLDGSFHYLSVKPLYIYVYKKELPEKKNILKDRAFKKHNGNTLSINLLHHAADIFNSRPLCLDF